MTDQTPTIAVAPKLSREEVAFRNGVALGVTITLALGLMVAGIVATIALALWP